MTLRLCMMAQDVARRGCARAASVRTLLAATLLSPALLLAGCGDKTPDSEGQDAFTGPAQISAQKTVRVIGKGEQPGTPMAERVAVIGFLNKQNGKTRDFELKPGQSVRAGKAIIRLSACEKTAPWETYADDGAFVQLLVNNRRAGESRDKWVRVFSGWLFRENPAANIVQHPIYDVWVKECKMRFPGEEEVAAPAAPSDGAASQRSSAPQSPAEAPAVAEAPAADAAPAAEAPADTAD